MTSFHTPYISRIVIHTLLYGACCNKTRQSEHLTSPLIIHFTQTRNKLKKRKVSRGKQINRGLFIGQLFRRIKYYGRQESVFLILLGKKFLHNTSKTTLF